MNLNKIDIKLLDLKDKPTRIKYSTLLTNYEDVFTYPLGDKKFYIRHGYGGLYDYFAFFEQLGQVHYIVAEDKGNLIAAGCAVLRTINKEKVWYLCDFKLLEEYRGKGILEKIFKKYVFPFYFKSNKMFFVNMSPAKDNGLIKKSFDIFKLFDIKTTDLYFFEWSNSSIIDSGLNLDDFVILTNATKKDIVIDSKPYNIYHLVHKDVGIDWENFHKEELSVVTSMDTLMYCSPKNDIVDMLLQTQQPTTIGSFVSHKFKPIHYSSSEI